MTRDRKVTQQRAACRGVGVSRAALTVCVCLFSGAAFLIGLLGLASWASAADADSWLNASDCGASGSQATTTAATVAGSHQITVAAVGDFRVGQGVMVSKCNIHASYATLWGPRKDCAAVGPLQDFVELRGYDGSQGSWVCCVLDIAPSDQPAFRWTDDLGRTWNGEGTKVTYDWQPLDKGLEVRFKQITPGTKWSQQVPGRDGMQSREKEFNSWSEGYSVVISYRDQLVTTIQRIEGQALTLKDAANRTVADAVVRHHDGRALQAAIERALKEKRNLHLPAGTYRISGPLKVNDAPAITIQGANAGDTVVDISEGQGACFILNNGTEVTVRNLSLIGHTGFQDRDQCNELPTQGGAALWGQYFRECAALSVHHTERVLVENCHARRMASECFGGWGRSRSGRQEPAQYTKSMTLLRCSVEDGGRNAFNPNDLSENFSVLHCRVRDVGGCTLECPARFSRFIGKIYVRGTCNPRVTGIRLVEPALNLNVHNNLIRNCGTGIVADRARSTVSQVIDPQTFTAFGRVPKERRQSHRYRGWPLVWLQDGKVVGQSVIEFFDPETLRFRLTAPAEIKVGAVFEVYPRNGANWNLHDNTLTGCLRPVVLSSYGSDSSLFKENLISRGDATGVKSAIEVRGLFKLIGNHVSGFDEQGSTALSLITDPLGRTTRNVYRDNIFEGCTNVVAEGQRALWDAAKPKGNIGLE